MARTPLPINREAQIDQPWHQLGRQEVAEKLGSSGERGLSEAEAQQRLQKYGPNRLEEAPPKGFLAMLWEQLNNFVVYLLFAAAGISMVLGEWVEASAVLAIVVLNAGFGIIQERRAEQALAALRQLASPDAQVLRDGRRLTIPSHEVVPGDIVFVEAGNYIPADLRLLESVNLRIEEAALTGESVPVEKSAARLEQADVSLGDRVNTAFMGTLVAYGRGRGIVIGTGMRTQVGLIAEMLQAVHQEQTPLQRRLEELGRWLGWAALVICGVVFLVGWLRGQDALHMFEVAVTLAIAAVPEGLPAVVTIALALGMREMIQRNALIRRLSSVETLGSATVIGSDKTGTLTQNAMTVTDVWVDGRRVSISGTGYVPRGEFSLDGKPLDLSKNDGLGTALWLAALNNDAILEPSGESESQQTLRVIGDPTEAAMLVAAAKAYAAYEELKHTFPRVQEIPFDSTRKRMSTIHHVAQPANSDLSPFASDDQKQGWHVVAVKGAPDVVLGLCQQYATMDDKVVDLTDDMRNRVLEANDHMAQDALRVIAVAYRLVKDVPDKLTPEHVEKDLVFVGLLGMIDPPRPEVQGALQKARKAGIRTVMITGDYPQTARAIALQIGLVNEENSQVISGTELNEMSDEQLQQELHRTSVFARVSPEHKVRIVSALRANGNVVAMTGDGVNDAPALKQADIGVAMGITGTDVAKETADMVLTDDNYASIVSAVEQGRVIYSNIRKFVFFLLSCNTAEIMIIFTAIMMGLPAPLAPIQLLWLNLLTDGAPALALGTEKGDPDVMEAQPRGKDEPIIDGEMRLGIIIQTIVKTVAVLGAYIAGLQLFPVSEGINLTAETMAFLTLGFCELARAYTARSEHYSMFHGGVFSNKNMNWAVLLSSVLLLIVVYVPGLQGIFETTPMGLEHWIYILPLALVPAIAAEITKWFLLRNLRRKQVTA
ncbi:MAG: cation-translocating P-type ATPase [Anaerolineales bacterium]|nr:cation-translocating P-type ATPase [Anaerolineales bacterium]MCW5855508.1 cation-translocating P-type ATPase [Anaerolineales bacterium]